MFGLFTAMSPHINPVWLTRLKARTNSTIELTVHNKADTLDKGTLERERREWRKMGKRETDRRNTGDQSVFYVCS